MKLNTSQKKTLAKLFVKPTLSDIRWSEFVSLIKVLGGVVTKQGKTSGSRFGIHLGERKALLHKPHPTPIMKQGSVNSARDFLKACAITPDMAISRQKRKAS
ncbi:MAG: hypothetical protein V3V61_07830 [Gammaproteobacteria bacterium]